ncbi:MAG: hypothetical protein JKY42_02315 [Flavobacteriales bacterium]|nr:hypothetical protein [Flavobacteriales bacterium]
MEDLKWQYQKTDLNTIYSSPTHDVNFVVTRRSDTSFVCKVPLNLAVVTCLQLFYDDAKEAREYCNMLWRTWGYLTVRRKMVEYQSISQPSLEQAKTKGDLENLYGVWIKSISNRSHVSH